MKYALSVLFFAFATMAVAQAGEVQSPWVSTDRTVDCSSYKTILRDVLTPGMTDEQKAIALFDFYRQRVYHYRNLPESRNPLKCINVIGHTLCGSQATCMKGLLAAAGIKVRPVSHPGHTFYEAWYDGQWHGYDTFTNFYIFTRGKDRHVASFAELHADPSLITTAIKEKRACPGLCPCGDNPKAFAHTIKVLNYQPRQSNWSVKDYALRPGEEIVRSWWPYGFPLPGSYRARDLGPMHTCGGRDRKSPWKHFMYWQPYGIPNYAYASVSFRHYFNGWMNFSPDLAAEPWKSRLAKGEISVPVKCPFYITGGRIWVDSECDGGCVEVMVELSGKAVASFKVADAGRKTTLFVLDKAVAKPRVGLHAYTVRFKVSGKAALRHFYLRTVFSHNAMAAPHLMPGKNKVTFTAANPKSLQAAPVFVSYRYREAPAWGELKTLTRKADRSPFTFEVTLPATKVLPQMQDLSLRCGRLAWTPDFKKPPARQLSDFGSQADRAKWKADSTVLLAPAKGCALLSMRAARGKTTWIALPVKDDWSGYGRFGTVAVHLENLSPCRAKISFSVRSHSNPKERTNVHFWLDPGPHTLRIPLMSLKKTKLDAITDIFLQPLSLHDAKGYRPADKTWKMRLYSIHLEPSLGPR